MGFFGKKVTQAVTEAAPSIKAVISDGAEAVKENFAKDVDDSINTGVAALTTVGALVLGLLAFKAAGPAKVAHTAATVAPAAHKACECATKVTNYIIGDVPADVIATIMRG